MPFRALVARELADLFAVLSHPARLRIVEELRAGELNVNSLQQLLGISHSGVSQHLSLLRAHRLISERREGKSVFYRLSNSALGSWVLDGWKFIPGENVDELRSAIAKARTTWNESGIEQVTNEK